MYSLAGYGQMIADQGRMNTYIRALQKVMKPGAIVVDIGTGPGIFALLACQMGAGRVYGIDPSDTVQVGRELAIANGYGDRITWIQDISTRVTLPEQADVILSDLRGLLPLFQNHLPTLMDARKRFLAPGGTLIPQQDQLWAVVVEAPQLYSKMVDPWRQKPYDLDMTATGQILTNTFIKGRVTSYQLLTEPQQWAVLDYTQLEAVNYGATLSWQVQKAGVGHGLILWFDTLLIEDVGFSNAPDLPELIYGQAFFPWSNPVALKEGDQITVDLQANLIDGDYVWRWKTQVQAEDKATALKATFNQSTFLGASLSIAQLRKAASHYTPSLNAQKQLEVMALSLMDGQTSIATIATHLFDQFPQTFSSDQAALSFVSQLSQRYSQ
ncbi:MAG: 50S ribosomal protein L11 methyltransferase [Leptolyngbyaceae cyanobacterium bins.59]|nr:50S ribosomal protein L11 methyltransferase [Leptolyngbyaceae cyanobacterium bins.59]